MKNQGEHQPKIGSAQEEEAQEGEEDVNANPQTQPDRNLPPKSILGNPGVKPKQDTTCIQSKMKTPMPTFDQEEKQN